MPEYDTELDEAGWNSRPRLTCHTCNETLIRQLYMTFLQWGVKVVEFAANHPSKTTKSYSTKFAYDHSDEWDYYRRG